MSNPLKYDFISKDGLIMKNIIEIGSKGEKPTHNDLCTVFINGDKKTLIIGDYDSLNEKNIHRCIMTMDINEECTMNNMNIILKQFTIGCKVHKMTNEQKTEMAFDYKEKGVLLFKNERYQDALDRFQRALILTNFSDLTTDLTLYNVICNNIALCLLKIQRYEDALCVCCKVIINEPDNVKCLLRRASAYKNLKDYQKSFDDLNHVLKIEPKNKQALDEILFINEKIHDMNDKYNNMCKKMFPY